VGVPEFLQGNTDAEVKAIDVTHRHALKDYVGWKSWGILSQLQEQISCL
jgi:hypothetical protein